MTSRIFNLFIIVIFLLACNATQPVQENKAPIPEVKQVVKPEKPAVVYPFREAKDSLQHYFEQQPNKYSGLFQFYKENNFEPVWVTDSLIIAGIKLLNDAKFNGLNPEEYRISSIRKLNISRSTNKKDVAANIRLDLALTRGIQLYIHQLQMGKLNPKQYHSGWPVKTGKKANSDTIILRFVKQGKVAEIENYFEPKYPDYAHLKKELADYIRKARQKSSEITPKYPGFILHKGDSNQFVGVLKTKFGIKGKPRVFDQELEDSIKSFQHKHGLNSDGIPGKKTYEFLGWTSKRYIDALRVNMERIRWLPDPRPHTAIYVNIAASDLKLYHTDSLIFKSKVIVGKIKDQTPVYFSDINYLVFNPCWTVPNSITIKKILPRLKTDSLYLQHHNMFAGLNGAEESVEGIDFSKYTADNFPYKIYQRSGPDNALGKVKFMFPNPYNIYLHDTPGKSLFNLDNRALSHGCVRVNSAMNLASILLYTVDQHNKPVSYYLGKGYPIKVYLKRPVPLFILYQTCATDNNEVIFYNDIYANDYKVLFDLDKVR